MLETGPELKGEKRGRKRQTKKSAKDVLKKREGK
jgi:hypothetical protein